MSPFVWSQMLVSSATAGPLVSTQVWLSRWAGAAGISMAASSCILISSRGITALHAVPSGLFLGYSSGHRRFPDLSMLGGRNHIMEVFEPSNIPQPTRGNQLCSCQLIVSHLLIHTECITASWCWTEDAPVHSVFVEGIAEGCCTVSGEGAVGTPCETGCPLPNPRLSR